MTITLGLFLFREKNMSFYENKTERSDMYG